MFQLTTYKKEHAIPQEENKKEGEETSEGEKAENDKDAGLEEEVVVPPLSATVEEVETHLWALLGKVCSPCVLLLQHPFLAYSIRS